MKTGSIIIHVPHASMRVPDDVRDQFTISDSELQSELNRLTDHFTDKLFCCSNLKSNTLVYPVSRFVVDPERFVDDASEPMVAMGHGVIYTHSTSGKPIRRALNDDDRTDLIQRFYEPHHQALTNLTASALGAQGQAVIIDAHSFPDVPLPMDLSQIQPRPDICLGTDPFHTPKNLISFVAAVFEQAGYSVAIDEPYSGTLVPLTCYQKNTSVV